MFLLPANLRTISLHCVHTLTGVKTLLTNIVVGTFCVGTKWWRKVTVVVKFKLEEAKKAQKGVEKYLFSFLNLGARWGVWSTPRPGRFTPGKDPVLIVWEAGWAPAPVWTDAENLIPTGIRSPDRQTRSESLYRLSYPGPLVA